MPIEFASVAISNENYQDGAITAKDGSFKIENVPVGRKTLRVSFVGYETITLSNLEVTMGKELVVNIELTESVVKMETVNIKAQHSKEKPINSYAPVSARTFSIEESMRYAGSSNDVSRMAMNFAGVNQTAETTNEIAIRGNSPTNVVYRLEGVEIPNPSHFGEGGSAGGPMSMLNNNVLSNSDFLTGAFPAEYSNTISGIFDLRMRNGNSEKHEFIAQTGLMGIELGAEGPISKKNNASYLVNYRYTNLDLLKALGMDVMGSAVTKFQDFTFKLNFPTTKAGTFSIFGLGGNSYVKMFDSERDTTKERQQMAYESDYELDMLNKNHSGVMGISHSYLLNKSAYTKFIVSAGTITNYNSFDSLSTENRNPILQYFSDFNRTKYAAKFFINKKINKKNSVRTGISAELQTFRMLDSIYDNPDDNYRTLRDFEGNDILPQAFVQLKHRFTNNLRVVAGVNMLMQTSEEHYSIEPRAGIKWDFLPGNTLSLGYGLHSTTAPIEVAKQKIVLPNGTPLKPNTELKFTKSHHFVLGYDKVFTGKFRFKAEAYYQYIFNAIVEKEPSSYSLLNRGSYSLSGVGSIVTDVENLTNEGNGYNYGLEFTLEKFMDRGMYLLSTLSLFESKYRGSDGILRNTAFNSNYVYNLLGGKEFSMGSKDKNAKFIKKFLLDGKLNWTGGQRYTPIDLEASQNANKTILDNKNAFSKQLADYFRFDLRMGFKWIGKGSTQEIALDIRNLTNRENPFYIKYNTKTDEVETKGFGMMPELLYRISF